MDELCAYAHRPLAFLYRYLRLRAGFHSLIVIAVLAAVGCSVGTQYGVKSLVDARAERESASGARSCCWLP